MPTYNRKNIRIDPSVFQYPADKAASDAIHKSEAFQKALTFISEQSVEKALTGLYRSSYAEITSVNSPKIYAMIREAMEMYGMDCEISVYIQRKYEMSALLSGIKHPILLISSEFLREITEDMLWGLLASEVAGIKNGFGEIKFVESLSKFSYGLLPAIVTEPLKLLFNNWHKYAEYSFDRANLIATGDFNTTMQLILLGEAPTAILRQTDFTDPNCTFMSQSREFMNTEDTVMRVIRDVKSVTNSGLYYASRYIELFKFYQGEYYELLEETT